MYILISTEIIQNFVIITLSCKITIFTISDYSKQKNLVNFYVIKVSCVIVIEFN